MRCQEVRQLLGPYMDSDLDATTTWRIAQHLETCAGCTAVLAREQSIEREIRERLVARAGDERAVFQRVLARALRRGRGRTAAAALLLAAAVLAVGLALRGGGEDPRLGRLLAMAVADHKRYAGGAQEDAEGDGRALTRVEAALGRRLPPLPSGGAWTVAGARVCDFGGHAVGYVMLRRGADPVSLFLVPAHACDLPGGPAAPVQCYSLEEGLRGAAACRDELLVLAVGHLAMHDLEDVVGRD